MGRVFPVQRSLKTINLTYQTPQETLYGTPTDLPTTEPSDPQISYTVASGDLPTFDLQPYSKVFIAFLIGAGKFGSTGGTLNWRMVKWVSGSWSSIASGSQSVSTNNYYTVNAWFYDVAVDDQIGIKLWANVSPPANWDYKAFFVFLSRFVFLNRYMNLMPAIYTIAAYPTLSSGNPSVSNTLALVNSRTPSAYFMLDASETLDGLWHTTSYGLFRAYRGDFNMSNTGSVKTHGTNRPYYDRNRIPTQIKFRELRLP